MSSCYKQIILQKVAYQVRSQDAFLQINLHWCKLMLRCQDKKAKSQDRIGDENFYISEPW